MSDPMPHPTNHAAEPRQLIQSDDEPTILPEISDSVADSGLTLADQRFITEGDESEATNYTSAKAAKAEESLAAATADVPKDLPPKLQANEDAILMKAEKAKSWFGRLMERLLGKNQEEKATANNVEDNSPLTSDQLEDKAKQTLAQLQRLYSRSRNIGNIELMTEIDQAIADLADEKTARIHKVIDPSTLELKVEQSEKLYNADPANSERTRFSQRNLVEVEYDETNPGIYAEGSPTPVMAEEYNISETNKNIAENIVSEASRITDIANRRPGTNQILQAEGRYIHFFDPERPDLVRVSDNADLSDAYEATVTRPDRDNIEQFMIKRNQPLEEGKGGSKFFMVRTLRLQSELGLLEPRNNTENYDSDDIKLDNPAEPETRPLQDMAEEDTGPQILDGVEDLFDLKESHDDEPTEIIAKSTEKPTTAAAEPTAEPTIESATAEAEPTVEPTAEPVAKQTPEEVAKATKIADLETKITTLSAKKPAILARLKELADWEPPSTGGVLGVGKRLGNKHWDNLGKTLDVILAEEKQLNTQLQTIDKNVAKLNSQIEAIKNPPQVAEPQPTATATEVQPTPVATTADTTTPDTATPVVATTADSNLPTSADENDMAGFNDSELDDSTPDNPASNVVNLDQRRKADNTEAKKTEIFNQTDATIRKSLLLRAPDYLTKEQEKLISGESFDRLTFGLTSENELLLLSADHSTYITHLDSEKTKKLLDSEMIFSEDVRKVSPNLKPAEQAEQAAAA